MKCVSCSVEVDPKWKFAIEKNECPFCGKEIMEPHLKNLFSSLSDTMIKLSEYPEQLNDWMFSNYDYLKKDSPDIIKYIPNSVLPKPSAKEVIKNKSIDENEKIIKIETENGKVEEVITKKIQSDDTTMEFFKRSGAIKKDLSSGEVQDPIAKSQYIKKLVKDIKDNGVISLNEDESESFISPNILEKIEKEENIDYASLVDKDYIPEESIAYGNDDDIPLSVLNMAKAAKGNGANLKDLQLLQKMKARIKNSHENFESGSNRGSGGFSRSS